MKKITYQTNRQLWTLQNALESAGYSKTADCYWSQIYTSANGDEIALDRDEDTTNDPAADLAEMLAPSTAEEPAEAIQSIMSRLTALKAESIAEADPFGQGGRRCQAKKRPSARPAPVAPLKIGTMQKPTGSFKRRSSPIYPSG